MKYLVAVICLCFFHGNAAGRSKDNRMPVKPIKLYYLPPSPPCRVVMMTAAVMGLNLDLNLTNIMEGAQMTPEFLKMNPQHTIPTMDDNGFILWERSVETDCIRQYRLYGAKDNEVVGSAGQMYLIVRAIITYFANAYGKDDSLYPRNPRSRAIVDSRLNFDIGTLFARYLDLYQPMLQGNAFDEEKSKKLNTALGWLNSMLDGRAFVAGDSLTLADISIIVTITNLNVFGYDMSAYENVMNWFERTKTVLEPYGYMDIDHAGAEILASFLKKA